MEQDACVHGFKSSRVLHTYVRYIRYVTQMDNLHFSDEFLDFLVQADADIHADALGFSAQFRCYFLQDSEQKKSRPEFHADSCGKWRKTTGSCVRSCTVPLCTLATHFLHKRRQMT